MRSSIQPKILIFGVYSLSAKIHREFACDLSAEKLLKEFAYRDSSLGFLQSWKRPTLEFTRGRVVIIKGSPSLYKLKNSYAFLKNAPTRKNFLI